VLDVETLWLSTELPHGFGDLRSMRVACCVLHDLATKRTVAFTERHLPGARSLEELYRFLEACRSEGCTLVGHNIRSFDWEVLAGEFAARGLLRHAEDWGPGAARLVDTLAILHTKLGWRPSLQHLATTNLGEAKLMDGSLAPGLWRAGEHERVLRYCRHDVELTTRIWQLGRAQGLVHFTDLQGARQAVPVQW
jgi:DEAD/DEAH box helicase domain-containing protein